MLVKANSIRSLTKIVKAAKGVDEIQLIQQLDSTHKEKLESIGFDEPIEDGMQLVPEPIGKYTSFNANGKDIIRKDLPKEPEPISFHSTWKDWHGYGHSGIITRMINKYPREHIDAPRESLTIVKSGESYFIVTRLINLTLEQPINVVNLANVMLEVFGQFQVVDAKTKNYAALNIKELNWDILPKGEYPWTKLKPLIGTIIDKKVKQPQQPVVEYRMENITKYQPDFVAMGRAGFSGYFVYGFESKNLFILESIYLDNATYVFGDDWEKLSKLSKSEIINGDQAHERIIHDKKWARHISSLLR